MGFIQSHETIPHTSEVAIRLRAEDLGGLLEEAGLALAEIENGDPFDLASTPWIQVVVTGRDREALLVQWLNELLYLAETEQVIATEFRFAEVTDTRAHGWVRGRRAGEAPAGVKAATYHGLSIRRLDGGLEAELVLDV